MNLNAFPPPKNCGIFFPAILQSEKDTCKRSVASGYLAIAGRGVGGGRAPPKQLVLKHCTQGTPA